MFVCVTVCALCPGMDWHLIQGLFSSHAQCFRNRLWIHLHTDQAKALTEQELIN